MTEVLLDAVIDSIKILPFLFLAYLAMEWIESRENERTVHMIRKSGRFGPVAGGVLGVLPQCGFSAAAANLYAGRVITCLLYFCPHRTKCSRSFFQRPRKDFLCW